LTLARYCAAAHLLVAPRSQPGSFVDTALAELGRTRRIALAVPHFLVVPYIVAGSDLLATLPDRVAAMFSETLGLATMPPPIQIPKFQIVAAWHERNHNDAPHRWLREQIVAVANEIR
jgi:DNA-binding transcriptional LysR family regulator